jgi:hypothetical protein
MTRSKLLAWFYRQGRGASAEEILKKFGDVSEALRGLVDLGMVFEYGPYKKQMFKVCARWSKNLELNSGQGGYRLGKFKLSNGESSRGTKVFVKTAAGRYVLAHR